MISGDFFEEVGTAIELFGLSLDQIYPQKLYRALDQVLPYKASLERHLKAKLGELFELDYELVLYDITSTYFEGEAAVGIGVQRKKRCMIVFENGSRKP